MLVSAAAGICLLVLILDVPQLRASWALARAKLAASRGNPRGAWEQVAPTLADNRELGAWLWAAVLLEDAGDASRCRAVIDDALTDYRENPFLLAQRARCQR